MKTKNLIVIVFLILSCLIPIKIKAIEKAILNYSFSNDLWYTMRGGGKPYSSMQYATYSINDKTFYCIEPGVQIFTNNYVSIEETNILPYSTESNKKIELIGYYGYDYPSHNTLKYRMAAQALIWEEISGQIVEFWTGPSGSGTHINVEFEKNEILRLIDSHNHKPSFDGNTFEININEEIEIIDSNNILNEFEIIESDEFEAKIEDNKLYITPLIVGNIEIKLEKKRYNESQTIVYKGEDNVSQTVVSFGITESVISNLYINSYGKIEVKKLGEKQIFEDKELIYDYAPLEGVEFSLYADEEIKDIEGNVIFRKDDLINNKTTDKEGKVIFDNLNIGDYKLVETKTLQGYIVNEKEYIIQISEKDKIKTITVKNELKKTIIEVPSTGLNKSYMIEFMSIIFIVLGVILINVKKIKY